MGNDEMLNANSRPQPVHDIHVLAQRHAQLTGQAGSGADVSRSIARFESAFQGIYRDIAVRAESDNAGTRAEEWLLDNRHVIQEALTQVREGLPLVFIRQLPAIQEAQSSTLRSLALAEVLVEDNRPLDIGQLAPLVGHYQTITPLTIGELWALPSLLSFVLLRSLLEAAARAIDSDAQDGQANDNDEGGVSVAGAVLSLRGLQAHNWRGFFERVSLVHKILIGDPAGEYEHMDFVSRDRYRSAVELFARRAEQSELAVAELVVSLCHEQSTVPRERHVGFYLLDNGREALQAALGIRPNPAEKFTVAVYKHPGWVYFGSLAAFSLPILTLFALYLAMQGSAQWLIAVATALAAIPVLGLAVALLNALITHLCPPHRLAKLDFAAGIAPEYRTAVITPVLFSGRDDVDSVIDRLEVNYLSNSDPNLVFAVLSDFGDAMEQHREADREVLAYAVACMQDLNERHQKLGKNGPFLLLHRERTWNPAEGRWMGQERKRGKIIAFNRLLSEAGDGEFSTIIGDRGALADIRYVITLDADTQLPPGEARRMVGAMAHPLNRAVIDQHAGCVVAGHGFMQPRVDIDPASAITTPFARAFAGDTSVDLYTHAVSDAYQDLFGIGIFAGKGIYDPRVFSATLAGQIPDNVLLSHDLLEGSFGRAALLSDARLYEQYPSNIFVFLRRSHRWIRGDWQLLPWLRRRIATADGRRVPNPLPAVRRWQILDNLRRSIYPPSVLALFGLAWSGVLPGQPWAWTLTILAFTATPMLVQLLAVVSRSVRRPLHAHRHIATLPTVLRQRFSHWLLTLILLPYETVFVLDAIVRTLYRLSVSRRHLLEWTSAADVQRKLGGGLTSAGAWREMWASPALAVFCAAGLLAAPPGGLAAAAPLLLVWLLAPQLAYLISVPRQELRAPIGQDDERQLRMLARRTWLFFEAFMGPDDHWLPPDNYQEEPRAALAHRTSPTNIGFGLLSTLSAYDFGYIDMAGLIARLRTSTDRMGDMTRYRGHFLNWYETLELQPMEPRYVSTVDSGNLAASLLTLARGLEAVEREPFSGEKMVSGVLDTLAIVEDMMRQAERDAPSAALRDLIEMLQPRLRAVERPDEVYRWWRLIERLYQEDIPAAEARLLELIESGELHLSAERLTRLRQWMAEVRAQARVARRVHSELEPWHALLDAPPELYIDRESKLCELFAEVTGALRESQSLVTIESVASDVSGLIQKLDDVLEEGVYNNNSRQAAKAWNLALRESLATTCRIAGDHRRELQKIVVQADQWVLDMDFRFIYDQRRHLFRIGFNVTESMPDPNYYDLLASEARLAGYVAIAKGDVPVKHWLHLERPFRRLKGRVVLMSWGATLFEYLMPRLFMETPADSLLARGCRSAIRVHREFMRPLHLPWGISESGYYELDAHLDYQYRAFGVPGIGFRRDLGDRLVVSPYSSMMALSFEPRAVMANLRELIAAGGMGHYGLYEAIDYGVAVTKDPRRTRIVRSYMSHHQGMVLLAINNYLNGDLMVRRFEADSRVAGLRPLLHERPPARPPAPTPWLRSGVPGVLRMPLALETWSAEPHGSKPAYNVLSNGQLSLIQSADGGGGLHWHNLALTRWEADRTTPSHGHWHYVMDLDTDDGFSVSMDPMGGDPRTASVAFGPQHMEYQRRASRLLCRLRVAVAAQHDIEVRHLTISNESEHARRLRIGGYAEIALAPAGEDRRHPAFAKLFVESRYIEGDEVMLYRRRPRNAGEKPVYLAHTVLVQPDTSYRLGWETDRERFIGRGGSASRPRALNGRHGHFSGNTGAVLDTVIGTGVDIKLPPYAKVEIAYLTGVARSREELLAQMRWYRAMPRVQWIFDQARMQSEQELHNLLIVPADVEWMSDLLSRVLAPSASLRAPPEARASSRAIQDVLWRRGISGDCPVLLLRVAGDADPAVIEQVLQAHTYWCGRGQCIDLVILDDVSEGYMQPTRDRLHQAIEEARARSHRRLHGSVFVVPARELPGEDRLRIQAAAMVVLDAARGSVRDQLAASHQETLVLPPFVPVQSSDYQSEPTPYLERPEDLLFDNGTGGFSADGREYVIHLKDATQRPPAPWINVIANPDFGCLASESGGGCTWAGNSGEHRLTPWHNDPVCDPPGEVVFLRDEETAEVWTPTPAPRPADGPYQVRHGAGYTEYRHNSHGLEQCWRVYVDRDHPVKLARLTLTNHWSWTRRLTATYYLEWVLGVSRQDTGAHIIPDYEPHNGVLLARNAFSRDPNPGVAFLSASLAPHGLTTDRCEFIGRGGSLESPAALFRIGLSGRVDPGDDLCAAYQVHIEIPPGETRSVVFVIGHGSDRAAALDLAERFCKPGHADTAMAEVDAFWRDYLGSVQVETPDTATNLLLNHWLPYQTLVCRYWGRTAFYQSSGAYGFRDQLQDVLALLWARPQWTRAHIVRSASRQFQDGDVLHWWHEAPLRGVRTRCSDDLLWLPFVTAHYIAHTGDHKILSESAPYLAGEPLERDESERFVEFEASGEWGSLYEHCCRAIEHAARVGPHGLPTIGSGDWNDGFNRVSTTGRGESVWLAWFLIRVCRDFAPLCERLGDHSLAAHYLGLAKGMEAQVETAGWDGEWYRRAYYDDGTPLGAADSDECRIDLIAQAWSVMAGTLPSDRSRQAMASAYKYLVREQEGQILLLAPAFNMTQKDPGYIKSYPPGIRENGGQYTHAATWAVWAAAGLGDGERAWSLFRMLNPIHHAADPESVRLYRTEPYVLAGDVYGVEPHIGRGGWTWYTGASGWLYRAGLEALLGLQRHGKWLEFHPCLPPDWDSYSIILRHGRSHYQIKVKQVAENTGAAVQVSLDDQRLDEPRVALVDDGQTHRVSVTLTSAGDA